LTAANRPIDGCYMNSSGDITKRVVPSRRGDIALGTAWPGARLSVTSKAMRRQVLDSARNRGTLERLLQCEDDKQENDR
jgi:hypothetical protein